MTEEDKVKKEGVLHNVYEQIVNSKAFLARFPTTMPVEEFVDGLKGDERSRNGFIAGLENGTMTRAQVFRQIIEQG
jgi:hypothetical protein